MITEEEKLQYLQPVEGLEQVKEFIGNAFKTKSNGNVSLYNLLVQQLRVRDDSELLWRLYLALPTRLNLITSRPESFRELIQSLYTFDWENEKKIVIAFMNLVSLFVSSNPIFLIPSLQMLVKNLVPPKALVSSKEEVLTEEYYDELKQRQEYLHRTIHIIFHLAPAAMLEISPILIDNFPHKRHSSHVLQEYVTQLLMLCEKYPMLQGKVVELITMKCLELDVDIVIEDSGEVHIVTQDEDEGEEGNDLFQLDDNYNPNNYQAMRRRAGMGEEGMMKIRDDVSETAQKLDSILVILLSFISSIHSREQMEMRVPGGGVDPEQSPLGKLFYYLLDSFELRVMTTYKSKYVQFALFYCCQLSPPLGTVFLQRLSALFLDPSNHLLSRQSAVVYLSSLIARGNFISFHTAREYLSLLLQWASKYVQQKGQESIPRGVSLHRVDSDTLADYSSYLESATLGAYGRQGSHLLDEYGRKVITDYDTLSKHETFFCCVQSLCYAVCFLGISMAQIMSKDSDEKRNWEIVLGSEYHPLRYCIPTVRNEFLKIAAIGGLISNSQFHPDQQISISLSTSSTSLHSPRGGVTPSSRTTTHNPLDTFFPFDPCLLCQVHEYIKDSYRIWESDISFLAEGGEGDDDDERSEDEGVESVEDSEFLSSVASSIASMALSYGDSMNIAHSAGGALSGGGGATAYNMANLGESPTAASALAMRYNSRKSDLRKEITSPPSNSSSPYRAVASCHDIGSELISTPALVGEEAWLAQAPNGIRSKRSRQYSVSSVGSW